jgi:hypothetical protein
MWEWSKEIINHLRKEECVTANELLNIEIGTRLLAGICAIQDMTDENGHVEIKILENKIDNEICEWAEDIMKRIKQSKCLTEEEFNFVRLSMVIMDMHSALLDEHLQVSKTDRFELMCSPYIKRESNTGDSK